MQYGDLADVVQSCKEKGFVLTFLEQHKLCTQVVCGLAFIASKRFLVRAPSTPRTPSPSLHL